MACGQGTNGGVGGQTSGGSNDEDKWHRIWKIQAPMKVRVFTWKCLHNIVPVNEILY